MFGQAVKVRGLALCYDARMHQGKLSSISKSIKVEAKKKGLISAGFRRKSLLVRKSSDFRLAWPEQAKGFAWGRQRRKKEEGALQNPFEEANTIQGIAGEAIRVTELAPRGAGWLVRSASQYL